jgi:HPt (histidine-containing phosphotransfer) domain-containing protein
MAVDPGPDGVFPTNGARAAGGSPKLLREAVLVELEELEGDVLTELVSLYFDEAAKEVSELIGAIGRGDTLQVGQTAHKLGGSSSTVGAELVSNIACELEATAKAGDLPVAAELLEKLRSALNETRTAFRTRAARTQADDETDRR